MDADGVRWVTPESVLIAETTFWVAGKDSLWVHVGVPPGVPLAALDRWLRTRPHRS